MIGIKIADGSYFPILEEAEMKKKKVILTTVKDEQSSVQIDLYRSGDARMSHPEYIGSLVIDQIAPAPNGEPEIELLMALDDKGNLVSTARDSGSDNQKSLAINMEALPSDKTYSIPNFSLSDSSDEEDSYETPNFSPVNGPPPLVHEEKNHRPLLLIAAAGILAAILLLGFFFLLPRLRESGGSSAKNVVPAAPGPPAAQTTVPARQKTVPAPQPAPPVPKSEQVMTKPESVGVWYSTVKGDNLWNLSRSFYRNPWLYKKIAEENAISNPDLIQQNFRLYIPDVETGGR